MPILLLVFEYPSLNGGEQSILATLGHVQAAGYEVHAAAPPAGPLAGRLAKCSVQVHPIHYEESGTRRPLNELRKSLAQIIDRVRPDVLHANSLSTSRISGPVAAEIRVPSAGHLRDIMRLNDRVIADLAAHQRLLAVSEATRRHYIAAGIPAEKIFTIYNGVDLIKFRPTLGTKFLHAELGIADKNKLVAAIGQIGLRKGFDVFLQAAKLVATKQSDVSFLIVGQRFSQKEESLRFERDLHELAARSPLRGRIHFLGWRDDMQHLLPELTVLAHAARQEPLGRVLLEAAACGLPIVATDVGGTREIVGGEPPRVLIVPPDDPERLAAAVSKILTDPELRHGLGERARRQAESKFDVKTAAENLLGHYKALRDSVRA